ncbi:response regulator transcription factor [Clostridium uliginosum]|uniref:Stage 0 sporulation protein A homolog n=1 Tax=Clostridium uliginosum TaxID=119641 RepID=A0A1I1L2L1_9CLOT|nr:response regulator transcription factor [Clostridium uliginosum]SFC67165.1 DNA-binding response regulator, OmpR family, contains REC and winged-helix (wHTH) domain [Clostridium uliginosum]
MDKILGKILIIDSDESINQITDMYLKKSGYKTKFALNGKEIQKLFIEYKPDIVLLDLLTKNIHGIDFLKWVRNQSNIPVIIITQKNDTFDKVLALDLGADDYIVKPFEPEELIARLKAVLRRYCIKSVKSQIIFLSDLVIYLNSYRVVYKDKDLKMPLKEFELLCYLANNKNKVFTRKELLCEVWGHDYLGDSRTVDVHIKRLREKLNGSINWSIQTVWGIGYKFEVKE